MVYAASVGEEQVAVFKKVFTAVRYLYLDAHLKKYLLWYMNSITDSCPIFLIKKSKIIILRYIHIHTQKQQIGAEKGNK